jgi:cell division protein FtsL
MQQMMLQLLLLLVVSAVPGSGMAPTANHRKLLTRNTQQQRNKQATAYC